MEVRLFDHRKVVFEKEIGKGSFGTVYRATITGSRLPDVAIKVFSKEIQAEETEQKAYEELSKVACLEHENVVKLLGMVQDRIPWLVFEYMKDGNLLHYVIRKKNPNEKKLIGFCRDICKGMAYLHRNQYLHRDLAARNILLEGRTAKVADLGLCSVLAGSQHNGDYSVVGKMVAVRHAAAECIVEAIYSPESDVWSFGVLMWEIWTGGQLPYGRELKEPEIRRVIAEGMKPTDFLAPNCGPSISSVLTRVLQVERCDRPSFHELLLMFEDILDGQQIRVSRYSTNSPSRYFMDSPPRFSSQSPSQSQSPIHSAYQGQTGAGSHPPRHAAYSPPATYRFGVEQKQHPDFSSTPDLKKSASPSREAQFLATKVQGPGTRRGGNSSRDLLDIPPEVNLNRRNSEEPVSDPRLLQPRQLHSREASKLLSVPAQNLSNRLHKSQSDIHEEMMKEFIPNRFQRNKNIAH